MTVIVIIIALLYRQRNSNAGNDFSFLFQVVSVTTVITAEICSTSITLFSSCFFHSFKRNYVSLMQVLNVRSLSMKGQPLTVKSGSRVRTTEQKLKLNHFKTIWLL